MKSKTESMFPSRKRLDEVKVRLSDPKSEA